MRLRRLSRDRGPSPSVRRGGRHHRGGFVMGLDITAYSKATLLPAHAADTSRRPFVWCDETDGEKHVQTFAYSAFPRSFRGLADADKPFGDGMIGGRCYDTSAGKTHEFRAGSYFRYGRRRELLSQTFLGVEPDAVYADPDA